MICLKTDVHIPLSSAVADLVLQSWGQGVLLNASTMQVGLSQYEVSTTGQSAPKGYVMLACYQHTS